MNVVLQAGGGLTDDGLDDKVRVRIDGGRIVDVLPGLGAQASSAEATLDFGDRFMCPGFVDVHAHFEVAARCWHTTVDCRVPGCKTVDDVVEVLAEAARTHDGENWLIGQANLFFDRKLAEGRLPSKADLDRASREIPIAVRAGGHITVLNQAALEAAGIDRSYEPPRYSVTGLPVVEQTESGAPTGVVKEMDNLLPLPDLTGESLETALTEGARELFTRHGVTVVGEISETVEGLESMDRLIRRGEMPLSVAAYLWAPGTMKLEEACTWSEHLNFASPEHRMKVQGLKLFADGGFSAASAAVKRPYVVEPRDRGSLAFSPEEFARAIRMAANAGLQLAVHANGERAQELACRELAAAPDLPWRLRPRIEHAGNFVPSWDITEAWRQAGIIAVPQPAFIYAVSDFMPDYVGDYGRKNQFPLRRLIDEGWRLSTSSDVWVGSERSQTSPLFSIWCCVARTTFMSQVLEADQAITVDEALRMATIDGAAVLGQDHERGSLAEGKRADVVVLDRDPRSVPTDEIPNVNVDFVFVDGELVYTRDGAKPFDRIESK